jgi:serine/threonine-protein kinase
VTHPDRIGPYRIVALLGQGGMASVYLAIRPGRAAVNKLLVVKVLRDDLVRDDGFVDMFLNEARLAARLNHPNVVHTYDVDEVGGRHLIAMDYLDGQTLHALLRKAGREAVPLEVQVRVLADTLAGLHYAHTLKDFDGTPLHAVHRDVSPQNVFITYEGQACLVDFGIAKAVGAASNTNTGIIKGKFGYIAPEQIGVVHVDQRADLFSVGVMLWEAMAQRRFMANGSDVEILGRRLAGADQRIRDAVPTADRELASICDKATALRPFDRCATADDFRLALEGWLEGRTPRTSAREVGRFVSDQFVEERASLRALVDGRIKALLRETTTGLVVPTIPPSAGSTDDTPTTAMGAVPAAAAAAAAALLKLPPPPPVPVGADDVTAVQVVRHRDSVPPPSTTSPGTPHGATVDVPAPPPAEAPRRRALPIAAALLAVAAIVGFAVTRSPANASKPAPTSSAEVAAPSPHAIALSITYGPAGATAKLDGEALAASPVLLRRAADGASHALVVEAPGFAPDARSIVFDQDRVVTVALAPADGAPPAEPVAGGSSSAAATAAPTVRMKPKPRGHRHPRRAQPVRQVKTIALLLSLALASAVAAAPAVARADESKDAVAEASRRFQSGIDFFKLHDYATALVEFKKAYEIAPNYNVLYNLGQTGRELKDYAAAVGAFSRYLDEGGDRVPAARRAEVTAVLEELRRKVGTIRVETSVAGAEIAIDDVPLGRAPLAGPTLVNAGRRRLTATLAGYAPAQRIVEVASLEDATVSIALVPPEAPRAASPEAAAPTPASPPRRDARTPAPATGRREPSVGTWVALGGTVAAAVGAGVVGGLALGAHADLNKAYATFPADEAAITGAQSRTRRYALVADVLGGVAVVGAATTVVLYVLSPRAPARAAVAVGPGSLLLRGQF